MNFTGYHLKKEDCRT